MNGDQPAAEKQLAYLKTLAVDASSEMTKRQASSLIDEMLPKVPMRVP